MAKRIQRKRTKGWRMPEGAIYVGRPTKWGNPFKLRDDSIAARLMCVGYFKINLLRWMEEVPNAKRQLTKELRGKDLACWCPLDKPCHADVLLEIANKESA